MNKIFYLILIIFYLLPLKAISYDSKILKAKEFMLKENYDSAYFFLDSIIIARDSVFNTEYDGKINALYGEYQIDEQILINKKAENRLLIFLTIVFVLILLIVTIFYFNIKAKTKLLDIEKVKLKKATNLIVNSLKNKSIFLSNMSHEVRTPLNALVGFSRLLSTQELDSDEAKQYNEIIKLNADLLLKLINDIVDVSSLDVNNMYFKIESVEVVDLCYKTIDTMNSVNTSSSQIVFESNVETQYIMTDYTRLQQIFINLISNSIKFCNKGIITLSLDVKGSFIIFSVSDTGSGIPRDKRESLFQRFSKLNDDKSGTGLGLSICKLIIKRLGGDIWLDENYLSGAKFVFNHPIKQKGDVI